MSSSSSANNNNAAGAVTNFVRIDRRRLECAICMELYTDPRRLPCNHLYCTKCLFTLREYANDEMRIVCPECKQSSSQSVEQLMVDYLIKGFVEEAKQQMAVHVHAEEPSPKTESLSVWNEWHKWDNSLLRVLDGRFVTHIGKLYLKNYRATVYAKYPFSTVYSAQNPICYFEVEIIQGDIFWIGLIEKIPKWPFYHEIYGKSHHNRKVGDVIGFGIQLSADPNGKHKFFFTINGTLDGSVCPCSASKIDDMELFPASRMSTQGHKIVANFGHTKFKYDLLKHRLLEL